eukprot:scaffold4469_cov26-Tisochrysis_lutea.AAC.1
MAMLAPHALRDGLDPSVPGACTRSMDSSCLGSLQLFGGFCVHIVYTVLTVPKGRWYCHRSARWKQLAAMRLRDQTQPTGIREHGCPCQQPCPRACCAAQLPPPSPTCLLPLHVASEGLRVELRVLIGADLVLVDPSLRVLENLLDLEHSARLELVPPILKQDDVVAHS